MNVNEFLLKNKIDPSCVNMDEVTSFFISEMTKGLETSSSLEMIPTFCKEVDEIKANESVIVLDAGGTNFRTCLVTFDSDLKPIISDFKKVGMPGVKSLVSAKEFFSVLADEVERLIDKSDKIGFCFSYAAKITKDHDGIPSMFSKEIKAPEVVGLPVVKTLLKELEERGYDVKNKKYSLVNDTVATLLATKAEVKEKASGYIGFILGTGTNTSYSEDNKNILKEDGLVEGRQLINVESGNLSLHLGPLDEGFRNTTKDSSKYAFEKMISGAYLGGFSHYVLKEAIKEGLFSPSFVEEFEKLDILSTTFMSHYLELCHNKEYHLVKCVKDNEEDALTLWLILRAIIERAAKLTACNLAAAVLKTDMGKNPRYPIIINADGTTFYKTEFLEEYTKYYLHEFLELKHNRFVKLVQIDNSPVLGAAIAALSV